MSKIYKRRVNMWMTTSCSTSNLENDMRWLIVKCTLLACISVSTMQKAALSRAILALWHPSQANFCWGIPNGRPITRSDDYVGYILEILELDYRNHYTSVLVCDWIQGTRNICHSHVQRDRYGFTTANFNHMDGDVHANSFAFPMHCQQVFFFDDPHRPRWKIVCRTEVRSRHGQFEVNQSIPSTIDVGKMPILMGCNLKRLSQKR